jgi:hypothetical protein
LYRVLGDGSTKQAKGATIDSGGLKVAGGGATVELGGLKVDAAGATVNAGGLSVVDSGTTLTSTGAATALSVVNSDNTFTGDAMAITAIKAASTTFDMVHAKSNSATVFRVDGSGAVNVASTLDAGSGPTGSIVTAGGVGVAKGVDVGTTLDVAGLSTLATVDINGGAIDGTIIGASTPAAATATTLTSTTGLTVVSGGATVTNGGLKVNAVGATVTAGGLKVVDAGTTVITTAAAVAPLSVVNSHASFTGDAMGISVTRAANTAFDMVNAKANSVEVYRVLGDGSTKQAKGATIDDGGLVVTLGGATVSAGGLKVNAGGATVDANGLWVKDAGTTLTTTGAAVAPLSVVNTAATFTGNAMAMAITDSGTGFNIIEAKAAGSAVFTVDGSGAAIIASSLDSTSSSLGSIKTAGGMGVAKSLFVGAAVQAVNVKGTNAYQQISDQRFKTDIGTLESALERVRKLRGVRFRFRTEEFPERSFSDEKQAGFIAQEVEKVIPEVVQTDSSGWKTVAYGNFAPYLVEAIKAQDRVVSALQSQMVDWEARSLDSAGSTHHAVQLAEMKAQIARLQSDKDELFSMLARIDERAKQMLEEQNRRHKMLEQRQEAAIAKQDAKIAAMQAILDALVTRAPGSSEHA